MTYNNRHYHSRNSGGSALGQLLFLLLFYLFSHSNNHQLTPLGITGASFFTLGTCVLIGALFILDPMAIIIVASVGAASMSAGVMFGIANVKTNKINTGWNNSKTALSVTAVSFVTAGLATLGCALLLVDPLMITIIVSIGASSAGLGALLGGTRLIISAAEHKKTRSLSYQYEGPKKSNVNQDVERACENTQNTMLCSRKKSSDFAPIESLESVSSDDATVVQNTSSPRLFQPQDNLINFPQLDPQIYQQPPETYQSQGTAPPLNLIESAC